MQYCVYEIKCISEPSLRYIGMTSNFKKRMAVHKSRYKEHCRFGVRGERLYRILKAYGLDDFKVSVLADGLTKSQAIVMEMDMISKRRASLNEHHAVVPNRVFYKKKGLYD